MFFYWGGVRNLKFFQFKFFPKLGPISNFSLIQNSPNHPRGGGGGQENYGLFPLFVTFSNLDASLRVNTFQEPISHYWGPPAAILDFAGSERVPQVPLGWY